MLLDRYWRGSRDGGRDGNVEWRVERESGMSLCWEIVWTRTQIGMQFQTGGGHGWGGVQEFVDYTHSLAFLKIKLVGFDEDRYW